MARKGGHYYNNGTKEQCFADGEAPEGWAPGRLPRRGPKRLWYNNGVENRQFGEGAEVPEGFAPGLISGKKWHTNGTENRKLAEGDEVPEGFVPGFTRHAHVKTHYYNNGKESVKVPEGEDPPEGFVLGGLGISNDKRGRFYNDGTREKKFHIGEKVPDGWHPGRLPRSSPPRHAYNDGTRSILVPEGEEPPEGFVPGYVPLSKERTRGIVQQREETCRKRYGKKHPSQVQEFRDKAEQTCLQRYKASHPMKSKEVRDKQARTCIKNLGVPNPSQSEEVKERKRQTSIKHYGVPYPSQSEEVKEKMVQAYLRHYNVPNPMKSDEVKEAYKRAMQEKYGVDWYWELGESNNDSEPNLSFARALEGEGVRFTREFHLGQYRYDFKVGNILVEINPWPTHNTAWNPFHDGGIPGDYHQKKSRFAESVGYRVIHLWDWDDVGKVVEILKPLEPTPLDKCEIKEVPLTECHRFMNQHHLGNACDGQDASLGLYYNGTLSSVMSFGKPKRGSSCEWEVLRYCGILNIPGGAEALFKGFIDTYHPSSVAAYQDACKFTGDAFKSLGFRLSATGEPRAHLYNPKTGEHTSPYGAALLGTVPEGFVPISDCGINTWEWHPGNQQDGPQGRYI